METNQERAAHLVRHAPGSEHLLELRFGCVFELKWDSCGVGVSPEDWSAGSKKIVWNTENKKYIVDDEFDEIHKEDIENAIKNHSGYMPDYELEVKIIGHPPQLQHWLRLLGDRNTVERVEQGKYVVFENEGHEETDFVIEFNLKDGQPATSADYQAIVDICV